MKHLMRCLVLSSLLAVSCATHGPFHVGMPYGTPHSPHGGGPHPGIDLGIPIGTPIIAASDGKVVYVRDSGGNGISVHIWHGEYFGSRYYHLNRVFVEKGQSLKRGQLIGLSGTCDSGKEHLTFCVSKNVGRGMVYSETYDPKKLWLGGQPRCFDPKMDYSGYSQKDITLPIACGDYAKELISKTQRKD